MPFKYIFQVLLLHLNSRPDYSLSFSLKLFFLKITYYYFILYIYFFKISIHCLYLECEGQGLYSFCPNILWLVLFHLFCLFISAQ